MVRSRVDSQQESFFFMQESQLGANVHPPFQPKDLFRLAANGIYIGTSSWKYRGWEGMIYKGGYSSEAQFQRQSLREYSSYFPCVGVDFTFYTWPNVDMMNYLVDATPEHFRMFPKVTKRITMKRFPNISIYGKWAGQENPDFLNYDLFCSHFLEPIKVLGSRVGAFFFEFTDLCWDDIGRIEKFFSQLPRQHSYGIEIRDKELVHSKFYQSLIHLDVMPIFNSWTHMPYISKQWEEYVKAGGAKSTQAISVRGLLRPGRSYEEAVHKFQPYKKIQDPNSEFRRDLIDILQVAERDNRKAFVLINNRLEGCAPETIGAILQDTSFF